MSISAISRRYARALVEIGAEKNCVEQFGEELTRIAKLYREQSDLSDALESPTFPAEKKQVLLGDVAKKLKLSDGMKNFLGLLLKKNRLRFLDSIRESFQKLSDELAGIERARITSAKALKDAEVEEIRSKLEEQTGKKIIVETTEDAELLGGLYIEVGGKIYDGTVKTQLKKIADTLKKG